MQLVTIYINLPFSSQFMNYVSLNITNSNINGLVSVCQFFSLPWRHILYILSHIIVTCHSSAATDLHTQGLAYLIFTLSAVHSPAVPHLIVHARRFMHTAHSGAVTKLRRYCNFLPVVQLQAIFHIVPCITSWQYQVNICRRLLIIH